MWNLFGDPTPPFLYRRDSVTQGKSKVITILPRIAGTGSQPQLRFTPKTFCMDDENRIERATFAAGCFWGVEATFRRIDGVLGTMVGYTGGTKTEPTYRQVCSGKTGHAEAVEVAFDPARVSYEQLLDVFWNCHDPTQLNRQGPDTGTNYRSAIFYHSETQRAAADAGKRRLAESKKYRGREIVTLIVPASTFWKAEESHQHYFEKCGRGYCTERQIWE